MGDIVPHAIAAQHHGRDPGPVDDQVRVGVGIVLSVQVALEEQHEQCEAGDPGADQHRLTEQVSSRMQVG
jgi:hypothetical protein